MMHTAIIKIKDINAEENSRISKTAGEKVIGYIYDTDNHEVELTVEFESKYDSFSTKAFGRGFSKKLSWILGKEKEVNVSFA